MKTEPWGLAAARTAANRLLTDQKVRAVTKLVQQFFSPDSETRIRSADTARRLCESRAGRNLLAPYVEQCTAALAESLTPRKEEDWRTRSHLVLVAAHVARTPAQTKRSFDLAVEALRDRSNILRACALEAIGVTAAKNPSLRVPAERLLYEGLAGTPAMRVRARDALRALGHR